MTGVEHARNLQGVILSEYFAFLRWAICGVYQLCAAQHGGRSKLGCVILSLGKIASDWGGASMRLAKRGIANTYVMKFGTATINESQHEWCKRFAKAV
jgi:hypothetical protein